MTQLRYVGELEELLEPGDYDTPEARGKVRLRIRRTEDGRVELLADGPDAHRLDKLMKSLAEEWGIDEIEAMLCG